jgi:dipeptidyl aminopeptidase/acylaminoacyl peptidase
MAFRTISAFRALSAVLACFAFTFFAVAQEDAPAKDPRIGQIITQLAAVRAPRQTALSPDGQWISWVVKGQPDGEEIDVAPVAHPEEPSRVTACATGESGHENEIAWAPDSRHLAFFSNCNSEHAQGLYVAEIGAHTAPRHLTTFHGFADSPQWSPDGKFIGMLYVEGATRPSGALAAMKPPSGVIGVEGLEIQRVAAVDAASGELQPVTPANLHVYEFDWSPDSQKLAYVAAPPPGENNWWVAKLYTQPFMPGSKAVLGGRAAFDPSVLVDPDSGHSPIFGLQIAVPRWSPDGSQIAFIAGLMSDQGATGGDIYVVSTSGGEPQDITWNTDVTGFTPTWLHWNGPSSLIVSAIRGGMGSVMQISFKPAQLPSACCAATAKPLQAFDYEAHQFFSSDSFGDGRLEMSLSLTADNRHAAFIHSSYAQAPEVWIGCLDFNPCKDGIGGPVTHYNDNLKPAWGKAESVEWKSDGFNVQGWLIYPANYDPGKKYPMIVMVHGGPSSAVLPRWPGVGFGGAPFSALGYFVLMPNPRGSYGQGEKFTQANRKDFGYGDLHDILAGVDTVTRKYPVDPQRVGITGWSYGGFMTMFAVTQTNRFHAAVAGAGIANWQSYYGENSIDQWMIPFFGASVYDDPAVYFKSSAINFIRRAKTPTLVVVGDRDGECPAPQSFEFWHALRDEHVPTELVVYPGEGHHFVSPDHQRDVLERALGWFEQYMPAQ